MGVIKIKNKYNFTTEQIKGIPVEYKQDSNEPIAFGVATHADENYIYVNCGGDKDFLIEFHNDVSVELRSD